MSDATNNFRELPLFMPLDCSLGSSLNMHMTFTRSRNGGCDEVVEYCSLPIILVFNPLMPGQSYFDGQSSMALEQRCGVILARILKRKVPMESSFPNLNGDISFVKIRRELEL